MSFKFPRLLKNAADLLKQASQEDANVKHLLYNDKKYMHFNIKALYAIVIKALQNWDVIESLIRESNILIEHRGLDVWRIRVVISELLFGKSSFPNPENHTIQTVVQCEEKFKEILLKNQANTPISSRARDETSVAKAYFGTHYALRDYFNVDGFTNVVWSVIASILAVNIIIGMYAYRAYYEEEAEDQPPPVPPRMKRSDLNLKQD